MLPRCGADSRPRTRGASPVPQLSLWSLDLSSAHEGREPRPLGRAALAGAPVRARGARARTRTRQPHRPTLVRVRGRGAPHLARLYLATTLVRARGARGDGPAASRSRARQSSSHQLAKGGRPDACLPATQGRAREEAGLISSAARLCQFAVDRFRGVAVLTYVELRCSHLWTTGSLECGIHALEYAEFEGLALLVLAHDERAGAGFGRAAGQHLAGSACG